MRNTGRVNSSADTGTPEQNAPAAAGPAARVVPLLVAVAVIVIALDLLTKIWAVAVIDPGNPVEVIGSTVRLNLIRNPGAAFSIGTGSTWILTLLAAAIVVWIAIMGRRLQSRWWAVGLGLILGGALGNLIDRLFRSPGVFRGHVVDFVDIGAWPIFNVADSSITCAAVLLVVLTFLGKEPFDPAKPAASTTTDEANHA